MSRWHFELKPDSVVSLTYREMNFLLASFNSLFWLYSSQLYCCAPLSPHLQLRLFISCSISVKINWLCTSCCWRLEHAAAKEENDTCSRLCVRDYTEYLSKRALKPPAIPPTPGHHGNLSLLRGGVVDLTPNFYFYWHFTLAGSSVGCEAQ